MKCPICSQGSSFIPYQVKEMMFGFRESFTYLECVDCESLFIEKIPANMERYYPHEYYSFGFEPISIVKDFLKKQRHSYQLLQRGLLGRFLNYSFPNPFFDLLQPLFTSLKDHILDVGCGSGSLIKMLRELGFQHSYGIEPYLPSDSSEDYLKKQTLFEVEGTWDVIMFHHSFEHLAKPFQVLSKVRDLLTQKGFCLIHIPTVSSYAWRYYRTYWVQLDAPRHFFLYSLKAIHLLAQQTGFFIKDIRFNSSAFQFWGSEQYLRDIPLEAENSYFKNPHHSLFSQKDIQIYEQRAKKLNAQNEGDTVLFYLQPTEWRKINNT